jgi:hypothetical protein
MVRKEILPLVRHTAELPNGIAWEFDMDVKTRGMLEDFAAFERECCGSLEFGVESREDSNRLRLTIEGDRWAEFAALSSLAEATPQGTGFTAGIARAGALGFVASFLVCCVLPMAAAAIGAATLAASLARLDNPATITAIGFASAAGIWIYRRRRAAH